MTARLQIQKIYGFGICLTLAIAFSGCQTTSLYTGTVSEKTISAYTGLRLSNIDRSIRPQDDLYSYANGLWLAGFELPKDRSSYGVFNLLVDEVGLSLKDTMEKILATPDTELQTDERKLRAFYTSYFNIAAIHDKGLRPLGIFFDAIDSARSIDNLPTVFSMFSRYQISLPFRLFVEEDPGDSSKFLFHLEQAGLGMPGREFYLDDTTEIDAIQRQYLQYIEKLFFLAGYENPAKSATLVYDLEQRLAQIQWPLAATRDLDKILNVMSLADFNVLMPSFDWDEYFHSLDHEPGNRIVVRQQSYFQALDDLIAEVPVKNWQAYLTFHLLNSFARYLPQGFALARFNFYFGAIANVNAATPRERDGLNIVNTIFGDVFAKAYIKTHGDPQIVSMVESMVSNLKKAFHQRLQANTWMSVETRQNALAKFANLKFRIGWPSEWTDYSSLKVEDDDLVNNIINYFAFDFSRQAELVVFGKPGGQWLVAPQTVNAFYNPAQNEIIVPLGLLQAPIFDPAVDIAANYGALGAIIGHEIIHGFDDQGRKYDASGHYCNCWHESDEEFFNQKENRLATWYSDFSPLPGYSLNGRQTLGENIADIEGLALAFEAYQLASADNKSPHMVGFSGEQRFFLSWAQLWAQVYQDAELRRQILTGLHAPGQIRVNGAAQNIDGFYDAFEVAPSDTMYLPPNERIRVW